MLPPLSDIPIVIKTFPSQAQLTLTHFAGTLGLKDGSEGTGQQKAELTLQP